MSVLYSSTSDVFEAVGDGIPCMCGRISEGRVRGCIDSALTRGPSGSDMLSPAGPSTTGNKGSKDRCVQTKIQIVMSIPRYWISGLVTVRCLGLMLASAVLSCRH